MSRLGIDGFEQLVHEGLPKAAAVLLLVPPAEEKDQIAAQFVLEGLRQGEAAVVLESEAGIRDLSRRLGNMGLDPEPITGEGRLLPLDWAGAASAREDAPAGLPAVEAAVAADAESAQVFAGLRIVLDLSGTLPEPLTSAPLDELAVALAARSKAVGGLALVFVPRAQGAPPTAVEAFDLVLDLRPLKPSGVGLAVIAIGGTPLPRSHMVLVAVGGRLVLEAPKKAVASVAASVTCPVCGSTIPAGAAECPVCKSPRPVRGPGEPEVLDYIEALSQRVGLPGAPLEPASPREPSEARAGKEAGRAKPEPERRGLTNGLAQRRLVSRERASMVRVNGTGRVNGLSSTIAATRRGMTNGLTNGNGFTNGLGARRSVAETRAHMWRVWVIPIVAALLLSVPLLFPAQPPPENGFGIDGSFGDWPARAALGTDSSLPGPVDLTAVSIRADTERVYAFVETREPLLEGSPDGLRTDAIRMFVDSDGDAATGYSAGALGADILVEITGAGGVVMGATVSSFGPGQVPDDWNGWASSDRPLVAVGREAEANRIEFAFTTFPARDGPSVVASFQALSFDGREDVNGFAVSPGLGAVLVEQTSIAPPSFAANTARLLELSLRAPLGGASLDSLRVSAVGTFPTARLQTASVLDASGGTVAVADRYQNGFNFVPSPALPIPQAGTTLTVSVVVDTSAEGTLGLRLERGSDVRVTNATVSVVTIPADRDLAYVGAIPSGVAIDGAFGEWPLPMADGAGELSVSGNRNVDLAAYDFIRSGNTVGIYAGVAGRVLQGTLVPARNPQVPRPTISDSDRDSVPDLDDPYPNDFDNDGTPDAETGGDFDGDLVTDYGFAGGTDYWLNTTIPDTFPPPYGGRPVSLYIGPVQRPVTRGEDTLRAFIDTDADLATGYATTVGADWMVEIVGRYGTPRTQGLFRFTGTTPGEWSWSRQGDVETAIGSRQLELLGTLPTPPIVGTRVVLDLRDWKGGFDRSDVPATRGIIRSPTGVTVDGGGYIAGLPATALGPSPIRVETSRFSIDWRLSSVLVEGDRGVMPLALEDTPLVATESSATYGLRVGSAGGALAYAFGPGAVKEEIILENPPADLNGVSTLRLGFSVSLGGEASLLSISGVGAMKGFEPGDYGLIVGNEVMARLPAPVLVDAQGRVTPCSYALPAPDALDVACPGAALRSAQYPVSIDPSLVFTTSNNGTLGQAGELLGWSVAVGDFNGDGYADLLTGAPFNDYGGSNRGAAYVYYGPLTSNDDTPDVSIVGGAPDGARFGYGVAAGRFNGDAYWDALVTRISAASTSANVSIYHGSASWSGIEATPDVNFTPPSGPQNFGWFVAAGNLDNASYDDVLISEPGRDNNGDFLADGTVYVYMSPFSSAETTSDYRLFPSINSSGQLGRGAIAVGKIDSDAYPDAVVGETYYNSKAGRVQFYRGVSFTYGSGNRYPNATLSAQSSAEEFGTSLAVGRVDGDAYADLAVGAPKKGAGLDGVVYVFYANAGGTGLTTGASPSLTISNQTAAEQFGASVLIIDYNDDGTIDLLAGAPYADAGGTDRGRTYWFNNLASDQILDDTISGVQNGEILGISLAGGRFSQDARTVIAAGAYLWDAPSEGDAGRVAVATIPEVVDVMIVGALLLPPLVRRLRRKRR